MYTLIIVAVMLVQNGNHTMNVTHVDGFDRESCQQAAKTLASAKGIGNTSGVALLAVCVPKRTMQ